MQFILLQIPGRIQGYMVNYSPDTRQDIQGCNSSYSRYRVGYRGIVHSSPDTRQDIQGCSSFFSRYQVGYRDRVSSSPITRQDTGIEFILLQIPGRICRDTVHSSPDTRQDIQGCNSSYSRYLVGYRDTWLILLQIAGRIYRDAVHPTPVPGKIYRDAVHSSPDTRQDTGIEFILLQIPGRIQGCSSFFSRYQVGHRDRTRQDIQGYSSFFSRYQVGYTGIQPHPTPNTR